MTDCCICGHFSGRREICQECAWVLWPHRIVNPAAKQLARKLMSVPKPVAVRG